MLLHRTATRAEKLKLVIVVTDSYYFNIFVTNFDFEKKNNNFLSEDFYNPESRF